MLVGGGASLPARHPTRCCTRSRPCPAPPDRRAKGRRAAADHLARSWSARRWYAPRRTTGSTCWGRDEVRGSARHAAAAARMPGLRVAADGSLGAGDDGAMRAVSDDLRRTSAHRPDHIAALATAAFVLLVVMCSTTLISVETAGIKPQQICFPGRRRLVRQNMASSGRSSYSSRCWCRSSRSSARSIC